MDLGEEVGVLVSSPEVVDRLEQCVMNWHAQITIIIEEQLKKRPQVCGAVSCPPFRLMSQLFRRPFLVFVSSCVCVALCLKGSRSNSGGRFLAGAFSDSQRFE